MVVDDIQSRKYQDSAHCPKLDATLFLSDTLVMGRRNKKSPKFSDTSKKCENKNAPSKNSSIIPKISETMEKTTKNSTASKLLNIHARLTLPLLKFNENNLLTDSDDEETLEFEIRPRFVFSCNMCLVCMEVNDSSFICEKCKMITYCTIEHLNENLSSHEKLCKVLSEEFDGIEAFRFAKDMEADKYRSFRVKMIECTEEKIKRRLDLWEREIILYPRVCRTCRKIGDDLIRCSECLIDNYCQEHAKEHARWCMDFQLYRRILVMQHRHGHVSPNFPDITRKKCLPIADNFDTFLFDMFSNNVNYRRIDAYTYSCMSLLATAPLTALFALQKTCEDWTRREFISVDIVGAEFQFECSSLRVWEKLFMHYLPNLKELRLQFTGPELCLPNAPIELLSRVPMCRRCNNEKRMITVCFNERKLYHEIVDTSGLHLPDLICLFNPGLYRDTGYDGTDTWPSTIEKFCDSRVPVVVTSYTEFEIPRDIQRIQSIRNIEIILEAQKNPFASVKPDRNFVSDDIAPLMYKNYYVSVVKGV